MKRCPECRRDYYDDSLLYCLDDGSALLEGPASGSGLVEPATAILSEAPALGGGGASSESATRAQFHTEVREAQPRENIKDLSDPANRVSHPPDRGAGTKLLAIALAAVLILTGGFFGYRYFSTTAAKQINSIAVMPFANVSGNPDTEYLSDGMTETLIRSLSQLPNLNVKARSSVFRYKGRQTDAQTIGKELGVQAILNGRVIQRGDQLNLNLELIDTQNENVIWTDQYERKPSDLVSLQNEIARDVSGKLKLKLSGEDQQKLAKNYTADPEVYRLYLQGRFYWNKRTNSEVLKAIPYFRQAVERDPNFALGYVGLADSDEDRDRPLKKEYIRRALDIDPSLAEAHASLGYQYMLDYDWSASEQELRRAMELNPNYPQAYAWNGARLMMLGKYDESLAAIEQALQLDPTSNGINFYKGVCLGVAGRRDESIQQFKKIIEMDPTFPWAHSHLSRIYRMNGDLASAAEERAISLELDGQPEIAKGARESFAKGGWDALQEYMRHYNSTLLFSVLLTSDEKERWIGKLTTQAEEGSFWLFLIKTDPIFDPLRGDPRFEALVHKFDLPQRS
jgi:TolB-like protein